MPYSLHPPSGLSSYSLIHKIPSHKGKSSVDLTRTLLFFFFTLISAIFIPRTRHTWLLCILVEERQRKLKQRGACKNVCACTAYIYIYISHIGLNYACTLLIGASVSEPLIDGTSMPHACMQDGISIAAIMVRPSNVCIVWYYCHRAKCFIAHAHALPCDEHMFIYSRQAGPERAWVWCTPGDLVLKGGESKIDLEPIVNQNQLIMNNEIRRSHGKKETARCASQTVKQRQLYCLYMYLLRRHD